MNPSNRHPVDRLADLRVQIKKLTEEADRLRVAIVESGDMIGDECFAKLVPKKQSRLDRRALEYCFGKAAVAACSRSFTQDVLYTYPKGATVYPSGAWWPGLDDEAKALIG